MDIVGDELGAGEVLANRRISTPKGRLSAEMESTAQNTVDAVAQQYQQQSGKKQPSTPSPVPPLSVVRQQTSIWLNLMGRPLKGAGSGNSDIDPFADFD
jgi:hypothetical protein